MFPTRCLLALLVLGSSVSAQDLNIDFGANAGAPAMGHAGAGMAGEWNTLGFPLAGSLVDTSGVAVPATVTTLSSQIEFSFDNLLTSGDDEALMDDGFDPGLSDSLVFSGLEDGLYSVFTYAWAPDSEFFTTLVDVPGSPSGAQVVGGLWSGGYELGAHYARHEVVVTGGALQIDLSVDSGFATCNGVQLVRDDSIGTPYCVASPNSISALGSRIQAAGSVSLSDEAVTLTADNAPDQPGLFYFGPDAANMPFGNGVRCVGGSVTRLPVLFGSGGRFEYSIDFAVYGNALAGTPTVRFQCWYRDPAGGGSFFNLSDGLEVVFTP